MNQVLRMTNEQHHAHPAIGSTALRTFARSPQAFCAQYITGTVRREPTEAQQFGSMFHCYLLEPDEFETRYAVMPAECDGDGRTKAVKEAREAFALTLDGRSCVTPEQMRTLRAMADGVHANKFASQLITAAGVCEQSAFWRDEPTQVCCKARFDKLLDSMVVVDLKTAAESTPELWTRQARRFRYAQQAAMYLEGRAAVFDEVRAPFLHVVVAKEPPYECVVYEFDEQTLTIAWREVRAALQRLARCFETGEWSSPWANRIVTVSLE